MALRATVAVLVAGGLNALLVRAGLVDGPAAVLGALMGMWSTFTVNDPDPRQRKVTALLVPLPGAVSATLISVAEAADHRLGGFTFLVIAFLSIWVRRFGPRATALGMIALFAAFFTLFIGVRPSAFPGAYLALIVGTLVAYVVHFAIVTDSPHVALRAARTALRARLRLVARAAAETLRDAGPAPLARLRREVAGFNRAVLPVDGLLAGEAFAVDVQTRQRCRVLLLDSELATERCVYEVLAHRSDEEAPRIAEALIVLADNDLPALRKNVRAFEGHPLATTVLDAAQAFEAFRSGIEVVVRAPPTGRADAPLSPVPRPPQIGPIAPTTLVAIQVTVASALAMLVGSIVPPHRYLWAVLTAFLVYNGTASAAETREKSWTRTTGTIVGVALGFVLVEAVKGRTVVEAVVGILSLALAFYTFRFSYTLFNFFLTAVVAMVFDFSRQPENQLLVDRLVETMIGSACGALAATYVLPLRTHAVVAVIAKAFAERLRASVSVSVGRLVGEESGDPLAATRALDVQLQELLDRVRPLLNTARRQGGDPDETVVTLMRCGYYARDLAQSALDGGATTKIFAEELRDVRSAIGAAIAAFETVAEGRPERVPDDVAPAEALEAQAVHEEPAMARVAHDLRLIAQAVERLASPRGRVLLADDGSD